MGDEDDGDAAVAQALHDLAEVAHALGRQHRGRLVEDQHLLTTPERAHDLDLLLLAQRQAADPRVGIQRDAQHLGQLAEAAQHRPAVQAAPPGPAQHQVLDHGQARHQQHMLKDGADPQIQALARRADAHGPAAHADLAGIRLLHAREHADQGGFAGAVLAEQDMNFAGKEIERDVVVGDDAGEALGNAAQGDGRYGVGRCPFTHRRLDGRAWGRAASRPRASRPTAYWAAASTELIIGRTFSASKTGLILSAPLTISSRTFIRSAHTSSGLWGVFRSCTESSAREIW